MTRIELKHIPPCTRVEVQGGEQVCIYTLADFRDKLATVDFDLQECTDRKDILEFQKTWLVEQRRLLREQLAFEVDSRKLYEDRSRELTDELIAKDEELQRERSKPRVGSTLAWTIAAISSSVLVGYIVADSF